MYQWFGTLVLMSSLVNVRCLVNDLNGMPSDNNYFSKIHGRPTPTNLSSGEGAMASPVAWKDIVKKFIKHRRLQDEKSTEEEVLINSTPAPSGSQDLEYDIEHGKRNEGVKNSLETGHNDNYGYNDEYASPYQKIRDKKDRNKRGHTKKKRNKKYKNDDDFMSRDEDSAESEMSARRRRKKKAQKKDRKAPKHKRKEKDEEEEEENYDDEDIIVEDDEENFRKPLSEYRTTKNLFFKSNLTTNAPILAVKSSTSVIVISYLKIIVISAINFCQ